MHSLDDLGILAIATRLERLSWTLKNDAALIYKEYHGSRIRYKWYPVIFILHHKPLIGVVELSTELSYAHPSVIQLIKELEEANLVKSEADKKDNRKRLLSLTAKGRKLAAKILPYSRAFEKALLDLTNTENNILKAITEVEQRLAKDGFYNRVKKQIEKQMV